MAPHFLYSTYKHTVAVQLESRRRTAPDLHVCDDIYPGRFCSLRAHVIDDRCSAIHELMLHASEWLYRLAWRQQQAHADAQEVPC